MDTRKTAYELLTPPIKQRTILTIFEFIDSLRDTWNMINAGTQFIHGHPVQDDKNTQSIAPPIISYRIHNKVPAVMGSVREIKPRIRGIFPDPNNPGEQITVFAQRFTYTIDFGLWESNWEKLEKLQKLFEDFMLTWTGVLKDLGVSELLFEEASEDIPRTSVWRQDLVSSHVVYRIDLEETRPINNQVIEQIQVKLKKQEEKS